MAAASPAHPLLASALNIAGFALFTAAAILLARRLRLNTTTPTIVQEPS